MRTIAIDIGLLILGCLLALLAAEGMVRLCWYPASAYMTDASALYRFDPLLGWRKRPNVRFERVTPEYRVTQYTDEHGWRRAPETFDGDAAAPRCDLGLPTTTQAVDEHGNSEASKSRRIVILGDSFAEGYSVPYHEHFAEVMRHRLSDRHGLDVTIANTGTAGWSTDQELLYFREIGPACAPIVTVLLFCGNDVWYNTRTRYWRGLKPRFAFAEGRLTLVYRPERVPREDAPSFHASAPRQRVRTAWCLELFLDECVRTTPWMERAAKWCRYTVAPRTTDAFSFEDEFRRFLPEHPETIEGWDLTRALLAALARDVRQINSHLVVFYVPSRWAVREEYRQALERRFGDQASAWDVHYVGPRLADICRELSIDCVEPTGTFEADGRRLYYPRDGHWTPAGNELAGELLARRLAPLLAATTRGAERGLSMDSAPE